jgi:hypothetical protein
MQVEFIDGRINKAYQKPLKQQRKDETYPSENTEKASHDFHYNHDNQDNHGTIGNLVNK